MPLALPALRDAIGLARTLYAAEADPARREAIARAGARLAEALRLARMEPGSLGHRAAPQNAQRGLAILAAIGWPPEVERLIAAARARLDG